MLVAILTLSVLGCSKLNDGQSSHSPLKPESITQDEITIDDNLYQSLKGMDAPGIGRRAQVEELGNCEVKNVGYQQRGCSGDKSLVVYLKNKQVYFPSMTQDLSDSPTCPEAVGSYAMKALLEGFCYTNHVSFEQMSDEGFGHRAQVGKLGTCEVKNVGYPERGCNGENSFVVFLDKKNVYYPSMTQDLSDSPTCPRAVGSYARQAYRDGLCE